MKRQPKSVVMFASFLALTACGGSGVDISVDPDVTKNKPLLEVLQTEYQGLGRTAAADVPTGTATYAGFAQISNSGSTLSLPTEVVGVAELEVSFAGAGSMTGTVSGFDDPFSEYDGTLTISGGSVGTGASGPEVTGDIAGNLTRDNGDVFEISGGVTGGFFGEDGQYLNGADTITVTSGGATDTIDIFLNAAALP